MDEKNNVTGPRTRKVLAGANFAVYTLVVIAIAALANWFVNRNDKIWDLTPNKSYSLSPQTIKLLRGLDRDVTLYVFDRKQGMREGHDLLDNYASASHRVTVKYVDPDREPGLAKQFAIRTYGTIVVAAGDRHFEAQGATEEGISNALIHMLKGQKTIYFIQGHSERDLESADRAGYDRVKKQLENEIYQVKTLLLMQKMEIPVDCSLLVVAGAQHDLVIDANPVAQLFGTSPTMPLIVKYGSSPIVEPLARTATLFPFTRSFAVGKEYKAGVTDESLCETSAESFGVADYNSKMQTVSYHPGKDIKGPLTVAVSGNLTGGGGEKKADGRFIALGTSLLAANVYLGFQGNRDLFMNMINWLSAEEDLISIRPKPPDAQRLNLTAQQMDRIF